MNKPSSFRDRVAAKLATTALVLMILAASGCEIFSGADAPPATPSPARTAKPLDRPTATVKRGTIVDSIKLLGRVAAQREADLYFANPGRVKNVAIQIAQEIADGQVLIELDTGDLKDRIATAQVAVETAKVRVQQADAKRDRDARQRQSDVAAATLAVQQAEAAVTKAQSDLVAIKAGPSPVETAALAVRDAENTLEAARRNLAMTQKSPTVSRDVSDRENERNWYQNNYAQQKHRFDRGEISQSELDRHEGNVLAAQERYEAAQIAAASALAQAQTAVTQAEDKLRKARVDLEAKNALPPDSHVKEGERAVASANLSLEKTRIDLALKESDQSNDYEYKLLQKDVDQAQANLDQLQTQLAGAKLTAPFRGKVVALRVKIGDQVAAYQVVANIADPSGLEVRGELVDTDLARVAVSQEVVVTVDALPGITMKGRVISIPTGLSAQTSGLPDRTLRIGVDWPSAGSQLGMLARVTITTQKKDDVLIVPARAVKTVGKRRFVEYLDGELRRSQNVELGVVTDSDAEVVSGLREGQVILAGQ